MYKNRYKKIGIKNIKKNIYKKVYKKNRFKRK